MTADRQRRNIAVAAEALAELMADHRLVITHGNGPQVGLLALQSAALTQGMAMPLDVLDAESAGMIGYLLEQEIMNRAGPALPSATLLTRVEVDPDDPAFANPSKPIGPPYDEAVARRLAADRGWTVGPDGAAYRRLVPSPRPRAIVELHAIRLLVDGGVTVVAGGGGGIPVARGADGRHVGIEAVVDKDLASALLAQGIDADALLLLTDVDAVWTDWGRPGGRALRRATPKALRRLTFDAGSMGPKVEAACRFVEATGRDAVIGSLEDAAAMLAGTAGTRVSATGDGLAFR